MRILIGVLAIAVLAGCSTVADIRQNPPIVSLESKKSAESVAECVRDGWQNTRIIGGSVGGQLQKSVEGFAVIAPNAENPWHVADIRSKGTGSIVSYRFYRTWQSPPDDVPETVRRCAR
jgi:hypothetical protein